MANDIQARISQIREFYRNRANVNKYATSPDFNLREIENYFLSLNLKNKIKVLDVGCGNGYSTLCHAAKWKSSFVGIDFVPEMIASAQEMKREFSLKGDVQFGVGDVTKLEFPSETFDVVISQRCLLNLPNREFQWDAMREISRVLRPGGIYLMLEGTIQGLNALNKIRTSFGLDGIHEADPETNWSSNKFDEDEMILRSKNYFSKHLGTERFGMYYFLSRVIHPLLVGSDQVKFDAKINSIAKLVAKTIPDFQGIGHVALFKFQK